MDRELDSFTASNDIFPVVSMSIPSVPECMSNLVVPVALPTVIVLADSPVPIFIAWSTMIVSLPILISASVELIEMIPLASKSNVVAPRNDVAPIPSIIKLTEPSVSVNASVVVKVMAFVLAFTAALLTVNVLGLLSLITNVA